MTLGIRLGRKIAVLALLFGFFLAANTAVEVSAQETLKLPDGVTLVIELRQSVRADRAKPGSQVRAKLLAPMMKNGQILLPAGAMVLGFVVEAEPLASTKPSRLLLRFEQARWKQGSAELNAYLTRYLVLKRTYSYESRESCPPVQRFQLQSHFQQTGAQQGQEKPTPPPAPAPPPPPPPSSSEPPIPRRPNPALPNLGDLCQKPFEKRVDKDPLIFASPALTDIVIRKLESPSGATVLESDKKNVSLPKGMIWEIRHTRQ